MKEPEEKAPKWGEGGIDEKENREERNRQFSCISSQFVPGVDKSGESPGSHVPTSQVTNENTTDPLEQQPRALTFSLKKA